MKNSIKKLLLEKIKIKNSKGGFSMKKYNQSRIKIAIPIVIILITFLAFLIYNMFFRQDTNQVQALSKYGSRGQEVTQIQTKLKRWGYYKGNIDGIYGYQTQSAVRYFQSKNGLAVDGIAGPKTLAAMGIFSSSSSSSSASNSNDLNLLARLIYAESRGEPYTGQVAVRSSCIKSSKKLELS